jgi:hypothetical protein
VAAASGRILVLGVARAALALLVAVFHPLIALFVFLFAWLVWSSFLVYFVVVSIDRFVSIVI